MNDTDLYDEAAFMEFGGPDQALANLQETSRNDAFQATLLSEQELETLDELEKGDFLSKYALDDSPDVWIFGDEDTETARDHFPAVSLSMPLIHPSPRQEDEREEQESEIFRPMISLEESRLEDRVELDDELMLLDSSHPQMQRFQESLKRHYERKIEETKERMAATVLKLKRAKADKESVALHLNTLQVSGGCE